MAPILYRTYTSEDALNSLDSESPATFYCHGEFAVLRKAIACFSTIGDRKSNSFLQDPSTVCWQHPEFREWLPDCILDPSGKLDAQKHHVFFRLPADDAYLYLGMAHFGCYGSPDFCGAYSLDAKLPREIWLRFGGYSGWQIEINHQVDFVEQGDLKRLHELLKPLLDDEYSHVCLTRYEEDSLTLHTNRERGWLMYLREPYDSGLYTTDVSYAGNPTKEDEFRCGCGIALEFPTNRTLPLAQAISAFESFFERGELSRSLPWTEDWR